VDLLAHLAHTRVLSVVHLAIVEYKLNIACELHNIRILLLLQFSLNGAEVHRLLYDVQVVRDL
jgi:hypothetical protein